jgi:hypothetical protein
MIASWPRRSLPPGSGCDSAPARSSRRCWYESSATDHRDWKEGALRLAWGSTTVARKGELVDVVALPGFVAIADEQRVGLVTYAVRDNELEVVTSKPNQRAAALAVR